MAEPERRPAFYAARAGGWRDWWTILHPPYTAWHLSYVVIGACLAPHTDATRLLATLLATLVGVPAGMLAAWRQNRPLDLAIVTVAVLCLSVPSFWVGLMLLAVFGVKLGWLPSGIALPLYSASACSARRSSGRVYIVSSPPAVRGHSSRGRSR